MSPSPMPKLIRKAPRKKPSSRSNLIPHVGQRSSMRNQCTNRWPPPQLGQWRTSPRLSIVPKVGFMRWCRTSASRPSSCRYRPASVNVLLITTDQQRADTIGAYGNPVCQTPNLDRLAAQGTRFTAARTQNPYCQPSRATILTGTYPLTHGVSCNGIDLPDDVPSRSVAADHGTAGFHTGLIGKAHFASIYPMVPTG